MLDGWLDQRDWLANDTLSIAEPFAFAYLEQCRPIQFPLEEYPNVQDWFNRIEARDSVARARARVQPHIQALIGS